MSKGGVTTTVNFKIDQAGVDRLTKNPQGPTGLLVAQTGAKAADKARGAAPVDTGALAASIAVRHRSETSGPVAEIAVSAPHWRFVEYGTRNMRPQPFMRSALNKVGV